MGWAVIHGVKVPFTNQTVFEALGWQQWRLREEVRDWCKEISAGKGWGDGTYKDDPKGRISGVTFIFTELDQALLFKLTWGGSL